jgi:FSR family fosmidomycin resistance protein-like MFS transporter
VARISNTMNQDIKVISLVCFPHMMSHVYWLVIPPMFPILMSVYSLNYTQAGAIITAFAAVTTVAQTPVGFLVDRIGARTVLIGGLALEAVAIGLFGVATEYWHMLVLAGIAGIGHTVFHPADYAILSARVSEERMGRAFSIHSATGYVGFAIAPIFMTGVAALWHWRASFLMIGIIGLLAALVLLTQSASLSDSGAKKKADKKDDDAEAMTLQQGLKLILSLPIMMCFLYFVLHQMGGGGVRAFLVAALNDMYGTPEVVAALALSAFTVGSVFGILSGGFVADRFGPRVATAIATLIPAAVIIALLGWVNIQGFLLVALLALAGFLIGLLIPSRDLLLRSITPPGSMGKVMGFASTGSNLGGALIPIVLGYAMDNMGGQWVFWISGMFVAAAFLTFITARTRYGS